MKKIIFAAALMLLTTTAWAQYDAGIDYLELPQAVPTEVPAGKVEVRELFWYGCPHCYHFEPHLEEWKKTKPAAAQFVRMPATLNPSWGNHARMFYAIQAMGLEDKLHPLIFTAVHEQRRRLNNLRSMTSFVESQGVDPEAFKKAYNSIEVNLQMSRGNELQPKYNVRGVPAVIVAGKYVVSGSLAGTYEKMLDIMNYLVNKEAK